MWVIKNTVTEKFFAGWSESGEVITADSKVYASYLSYWDTAAYEMRLLTNSWKAIPKDEA